MSETEVSRRAWAVLAVTAGAAFIAFLDVTIVNIAFPAISRHFASTSVTDLSWVFNAYNVVFAALLVPAGRLADLVGRRALFVSGLVLFGLASAACGLAPNAWVLVGARVVQAVGAAAIAPTSLALVLPAFPAARRATAVSLWGASAAVAAATGPVVGGVLTDDLGWRWVFYVNVPLVAIVVWFAFRLLGEARDRDNGAVPDVIGTSLLAVGVGAIALGIVKSSTWTWSSDRTIASIGVGLALLAAFAVRCSRVAAPTLELGLFRIRSFALANVAMTVFAAAFYGMLLANVLFLTGHWGYSELRAGAAITPGPFMAAVSSASVGRIIDRRGSRGVLIAGGLFFTLGTALFALRLHDNPAYVTEFLPANVLTGIGVGASFAAMSSSLVSELPPARFATGTAVGTCLRQIGAVLGIALLLGRLAADGTLVEFRHIYTAIAVGGALVVLIGTAFRRPARGVAGEPVVEIAIPEPVG
jgi:EmrB/QacA subfamily drug resistance transporter